MVLHIILLFLSLNLNNISFYPVIKLLFILFNTCIVIKYKNFFDYYIYTTFAILEHYNPDSMFLIKEVYYFYTIYKFEQEHVQEVQEQEVQEQEVQEEQEYVQQEEQVQGHIINKFKIANQYRRMKYPNNISLNSQKNIFLELFLNFHELNYDKIHNLISQLKFKNKKHFNRLFNIYIFNNYKFNYNRSIEDCNICFDSNSNIHTYCGHNYHETCISEWLLRSSLCPYCRQELKN